ncbi:MAG TPA: AMP-binding protein, partial [Thermoplasmata archaeon]|nr:AMP-binding protein [Thermoplasmata archaeon]
IVDTWWQTETGGFLCSTKPALDRMKPGSTGPALPGIHPVILDEEGREVEAGGGHAGTICIRNPWPGLMQTIYGDPDRYVATYFAKFNRRPTSHDWRDWPYVTGDGAVQDADGYYRILGRVDDVINVAGHRLGAKEIESACLTVPGVSEAAVVPVRDEVKGRLPEVFVALRPGSRSSPEVAEEVVRAIETTIGRIARPRSVWIVDDMPKTRSGKILRRVLAAVSNREAVGDLTTLANPDVVERIRSLLDGSSTPDASSPSKGRRTTRSPRRDSQK